MNSLVTALNLGGESFARYAGAMFWQIALLAGVLAVMDWALRRRVSAVTLHALWLLLLVKLVLPPTFALPTGIGQWIGGNSAPQQYVVPPVLTEPLSGDLPPITAPADHAAAATEERVAANAPQPAVLAHSLSDIKLGQPLAGVPAVPPIRFTAPGVCLLLWLAGMMAAMAYVVYRSRQAARWIAEASDAPKALCQVLADCRRELGVRQVVGLKLTPANLGPAVCGLRRPVILLPAPLARTLKEPQLRAIFLHELTHVRRRDVWWHYAQAALQVVHFYHPAVWLANLRICRVREHAVDEAVLVALGREAEGYPSTLVQVARSVCRSPRAALGLVGILEPGGALSARVQHMLNRPFPAVARLRAGTLLSITLAGLVLLPMARGNHWRFAASPEPQPLQLAAAQTDDVLKPQGQVELTVTDRETGLPVKNARATALICIKPGDIHSVETHTNDKGKCNLNLGTRPCQRIGITIFSEGYQLGNLKLTPSTLTNRLTLQLSRAREFQSVVGRLALPNGEPVVGARLFVYSVDHDQIKLADNQSGEPASPPPNSPDLVTDGSGTFRLLLHAFNESILITHAAGYARVSKADLLVTTNFVLQPWARVEGQLRVGPEVGARQKVALWVDFAGQPQNLGCFYVAETDRQGRFQFERVPVGNCRVARYYPHPVYGVLLGCSHCEKVELKPGETAQVQWGGAGRMIVGKLANGAPTRPIDWSRDLHLLVPQNDQGQIIEREVVTNAPTPQAAGARHTLVGPRYYLSVAADGTFKAEDIPPGTYRLIANVATTSLRQDRDGLLGTSIEKIIMMRWVTTDTNDLEDEEEDEAVMVNGVPTLKGKKSEKIETLPPIAHTVAARPQMSPAMMRRFGLVGPPRETLPDDNPLSETAPIIKIEPAPAGAPYTVQDLGKITIKE